MDLDRIPNLDANHLVIFYVVATENNFNSAAEKLCLSQPAITYHIKCLEESVQQKLIGFKKQKIVLTSAGKIIFDYAKVIYQQLVNIERIASILKESSLRVGIAIHYVSIISPVLEVLFQEQCPNFNLVIKSGNAFDMVENVVNSRLDLAIVQDMDYGDKYLKYVKVSAPEKLLCFASAKHPLCDNKSVGWKDIINYPIVTGPVTTAIINNIFNKLKDELSFGGSKFTAEVSSIEWSKRLVTSGKGISFSFGKKDLKKELIEGTLKILPLKEDFWMSPAVVLRCDTYMHPVITNFIAMVNKAFCNV